MGSCTVFKQEDAADDVKMTADGDGDSRDPVTPDDDSHLDPADGAASGTVEQKPVEAGALGLVKLEVKCNTMVITGIYKLPDMYILETLQVLILFM